MASWSDLDRELDRWADLGLQASLWWRDDDAAELTLEVERLIGLAAAVGVPVHLAVIPARLADDLTAVLSASPRARVLQHGYAHIDHAPKGEGSWELGPHRPRGETLGELETGFTRLADAFGQRFLPVLVPPWTRIDPDLIPCLPGIGFRALSMEGSRRGLFVAPAVMALNAHCDPIKWKGGPRFTGTERALDEVVGHLAARRQGRADPAEPTGLCTHHLAHDAEIWGFVEALLERTVGHPAVRWIGLETELGVEVARC
jgi:hypothetical protein